VQMAMNTGVTFGGALVALVIGAVAPALAADSAYITQANPKAVVAVAAVAAQPVQMVPVGGAAPRQTTYVPTPETTRLRNGNVAETLQIGNYNHVLQAQTGGNNVSNVGVLGGSNNNVVVLQGGRDVSNIGLINMQGLNFAVIQPPGSAPINMVIARLPNGSFFIKR
jgi:hypothetical protein